MFIHLMILGTKVAIHAIHDSKLIIKPLNYLKYKILEAPKLLLNPFYIFNNK